MSSPSPTAEPRVIDPHGVAALTRSDAIVDPSVDPGSDSGQPIDDLPPLIEPVAWEEASRGRRPPRRKFLATPPPVDAPTPPAGAPQFEIPPLIEPEEAARDGAEAPAEQAAMPSAAEIAVEPPPGMGAARPAIAASLGRWLALARGWLPREPRSRLALAAGAGIGLCLLVLLAAATGVGPFARVRHYPTAAAPSDPAARFTYFQEGAQAGDADAELQLAILYAKGEGVKPDYATAANWFRAAANHGVPRAQYDLGVLYERGRGVPLDLIEAANWYLKAAQGGHPLAQYNLAVCYVKGQGLRQDSAEAALWYRRAATQGVVQAMVNLAIMYEKGEGVAASPVDAYAWLRAAGRRGNQAAARHAEDMFAAMPHLDQIRAEALASDVAASIRDPERDDKPAAPSAGGGH